MARNNKPAAASLRNDEGENLSMAAHVNGNEEGKSITLCNNYQQPRQRKHNGDGGDEEI